MADKTWQTPQYSPNPPAQNPNCGGCNQGLNIIITPDDNSGGRTTELLEGFSIGITDLSDINVDRFEVAYAPYIAVQVALNTVFKESNVEKTNPILKGTVIDEVVCSWAYNAERDGDINSQTLSNSGAAQDPVLSGTDRNYTYTGLNITGDETITIVGSDGTSQDSDQDAITFGNYLAFGVSEPSMLFRPTTELQSIFDALSTKTVRTTQSGYSFNAFGTDQEYVVIAYPASWGESQFVKDSFVGGYNRIYLVNRSGNLIFTDEVLQGDTLQDMNVSNGNGHTEAFIFYQSEYPARTGDKPTVISKK
jgi:hypothetical protein